jgi:hypothetical protein
MMSGLKKHLGEAITVKQLAEFLNINEKTVRENYRQFGGIRIGRHYRFFTKEVAKYAIQARQEIYSTDQEERAEARKGILDAEGRESMGGSAKRPERPRMERNDRHGLLD